MLIVIIQFLDLNLVTDGELFGYCLSKSLLLI